MTSAEPSSQPADRPPAQPTAQPTDQPTDQPTTPPANPNADQQQAWSTSVPRRLVRRTDDKMLGGVCSGLAAHLGMDATLVRLLTVLVTVLGFGTVIIAYLVAWVIVPKDVDVYPPMPSAAAEPAPR